MFKLRSLLPALRAPVAVTRARYMSSEATATIPSEPPAPSPSTSASASPETTPPQLLSYYVPRTRGGSLPVYSDSKSGGSRTLTLVRKVDGSLEDLARDLARDFRETSLYLKPQARQVVIRGNWGAEVKTWLAARGF